MMVLLSIAGGPRTSSQDPGESPVRKSGSCPGKCPRSSASFRPRFASGFHHPFRGANERTRYENKTRLSSGIRNEARKRQVQSMYRHPVP